MFPDTIRLDAKIKGVIYIKARIGTQTLSQKKIKSLQAM